MNKLFTKIVGGFLGLAMTIGVGVMVGNNANESAVAYAAVPSSWVQCADVTDFSAGDSIIIATNNSSNYFNGATKSGPHWNASALSASAPASATADGVITLVTTGTANKYYLQLAGGTNKDKFVTATKAASKGSAISASDSNGWTFTKSSTNYFELNYAGNNAKFCSYNNQDFRSYASYGSGQQVTIYKYSARSLSSISVSTAPAKTSYVVGEYFDPTGLVITRNFSDNKSDTYAYAGHTSEFTFSPTTSTALATNNTSVSITYGGKTTSQSITVTAPKTPASVSSNGQTTTFETGETFAYGGTLTVTYTDSTNKSVTPESFKIGNAGINPVNEGTTIVPGTTIFSRNAHHGKTVYVLYTENNTTVYTSYVITVNALSSVTFTAGTDTGSATGQNDSGTLTKSGISFYCEGWKNDSGTSYRLYKDKTVTFTSTVGNIAKVEFTGNDSSYKISNMNDDATSGTITVDEANNKSTWTGNASTFSFTMSAQGRASEVKVTLASTDPLVELDPGSATSVTMMKGDEPDTTVKVCVKNITTKNWAFTFDEDEEEGLSTSSYISVSAGDADANDVHTLTITTKAVGSTVLHIAVSGTACATTIPVTVNAKPNILKVVNDRAGNPLVDISSIEIKTGTYRQFSQTNIYVEDTDENAIEIGTISDYVTISRISGDDCVTISGGRITGSSVGTCVVKFELNSLTSVYDTVNVTVANDSLETAQTVTFATGMTPTQGDSPTETIFTARVANTHFGSTETIPLSYFTFSYENNSATAVAANMFAYDFSHGDTVDPTHKSQTIYVFCSLPTAQEGTVEASYSVVVTQKNDPLKSITLTNTEIVDGEVDIERDHSLQLTWALDPTNPTDGRDLQFSVSECDEGVDVTVNQTGLIAVDANSGLGSAIILVEAKHNTDIYTSVQVNVALEDMTYTVRNPESWTKTNSISVGDQIILLNETASRELTGVSSNIGTATTYSTSPAHSYVLTVGEGNSEGTFTLSNGNNYLAYTNLSASKNNNLHIVANPETEDELNQVSWTIEFNNFDATITNVYNENRTLQYNASSGQERFCCYVTAQTAVQIYKKSGGDAAIDVTTEKLTALFNAIHNNFGTGKTYEWSDSCAAFDTEDWALACGEITDLANYSDYKLNRAVADANGNEIEQFLAKYDFLVDKFTKLGYSGLDYLGRFANDGINHSMMIPGNSGILSETFNSSIIFVLISLISIAGIGVVMYKRKQTNI